MRNSTLTVAWLLVGTVGLVGLSRGDSTTPAAPSGSTVKLDEPAVEKNETEEMQHLRAARKLINEAKDTFDKDPVDKADHRKEAIAGIDAALKAIDDEIVEYKADMKK